MTDHRTTAEQLIATAQPDSPDDRDQTIVGTALVHAVLALCDQLAEYGESDDRAIDHAVLQQNADRARAAFPGTYSRPTAPRICERRWSEMSGAHHECVLLAGHDTDLGLHADAVVDELRIARQGDA
ncbi:hypothetical protein FDJ33_gp61 [Gordonia phage Brandonk123]|uniref:Uncharacterized protein n=1 Tax=Gordonia phage Brandonk123 TaxID=2079564 RepID=A0A2L0HJM3_9CAUD|nr:hypothetical protein FDJ33_gp61 [Gordonia phage Brandonk123]AUX81897.1 hypothetical protein SEA_BRANDONK123_61 [Gordonia phage Brandonk123]